ncbi:MAG: ATP-dependent DNA ligase [Bryobacteraceae bacterium]|nr:ATP-dependent DNA ligase [Bryobacteraceae bacterium]
MLRFAQTCEAIGASTRKNEKIRLAAEYLRPLEIDEAARAAVFFSGRPFARREERVLSVGGALIWQTIFRLAGRPPGEMESSYRRHGDLGAMTEELLRGRSASGGVSLSEVAQAFETLAARRGPEQKLAALETLLGRAEPLVAKYIVKIITGDLRIGLKESLVEEAIAHAYGQPASKVRRANMLTGDIGATLVLAAAGDPDSARMNLFHPIGFMLATTVESASEAFGEFGGAGLMEDKYDGIRAQVHKSGEKVKLFSRTLDELVEFHELYAPLAELPGEFILDGEVVGWRDGRALPFTELQQRLGRKTPDLWLPLEIPVSFVAFDLLYLDGATLMDLPLSERRPKLEQLLAAGTAPFVQAAPASRCASAEETQAAFNRALERGNEGLMIKATDAPYTPGRRGRKWLKWKQPLATLDVVVTAVEFGHGRRHGVLSDYTFAVRSGDRLVNIGKAYSGLTDKEIAEYTSYFLEHTVDDQGFRRIVEPALVLEVAFNNVQRSNRHESGYALRFPRIVRLRPDKTPADIDTLETVRRIHERQTVGNSPG